MKFIFLRNHVKYRYILKRFKILDGDHLGKGNNFDQNNISLFGRLLFVSFGRVKLFLPICKVKTW